MRNRHIEVSPIAGALGAEIGGVDVAQDLDDGVISEIRQALLDYGVIFFRDQTLDIDRHKAFTRRFGEIFIHPNYNGVSADPGDRRYQARTRRQEDRRRGLAHRYDDGGGTADGRHPLRDRSAALRR